MASAPVPEYNTTNPLYLGGPSGDFYVLIGGDSERKALMDVNGLTFVNHGYTRFVEGI